MENANNLRPLGRTGMMVTPIGRGYGETGSGECDIQVKL